MAVSTNVAQSFLPLRAVRRGTPTLRLDATLMNPTVLKQVDLNLKNIRRDLARFGDIQVIPEPASHVKFRVALDGANGGTGGGTVFSVLNPFGARVLITSVVFDISTIKAAVTLDVGHGSTASSTDNSILAASTVIQTQAASSVAPATAAGVLVPAADFFVSKASAATTGLVGTATLIGVLL